MANVIQLERSMNTAAIVLAEPCTTCDGDGLVSNPVWEEMSAHFNARGTPIPPEAEEDEWWLAHGGQRVFAHGRYVVQPPPEELPCSECNGTRYTITANGRAVLQLLDVAHRH